MDAAVSAPHRLPFPPAELAARCRRPGFVWLDSALPQAGAVSLLASNPSEILRGAAGDWLTFERAQARFAARCPAGAAIGWVEYGGEFCFGLYEQPLVCSHGASMWEWDGPRWEGSVDFQTSMTEVGFCDRVRAAREHIAAGDIYQVNLAHRFSAPWPQGADAFALYLRLREESPAPQAAFLALGGRTVLCASPEEFLRLDGRHARTRPIKGTRPRDPDPARDAANARDLLASPKERAELLMITDLLRNDLGAVSEYGSVRATELFRLETFANVFHLVSTVKSALRPELSHPAALRACLPGGSITGAPKRRAREIIAELEPEPRGLYTGSIGCFGPDDASRFNIAIRTLIVEHGVAHFHVGSGIVADSAPAAEYQETLHKAAGILRAVNAPR